MRWWLARQDRVILYGFLVFLVGIFAHIPLLTVVGLTIEVVGFVRATMRRRRR